MQESEQSRPHKRRTTEPLAVDFLVSPVVSCEAFEEVPFDPKNPRGIPFKDGCFGDNPFVTISKDGSEVTFKMQVGSTVDGYNGTYPDALILFARAMLEAKNKGALANRYTTEAIKKLEEANMWLLARSAERHERGVQGTYKA